MMEVGRLIEKPRPATSRIEETETMSETSSQLTDYSAQPRAATHPEPSPRPVAANTPGDRPAVSRKDAPAPGRRGDRPRVPNSADYHNERRRYLARARRNTGLRQLYIRNLLGYLLLRGAWSFGFSRWSSHSGCPWCWRNLTRW